MNKITNNQPLKFEYQSAFIHDYKQLFYFVYLGDNMIGELEVYQLELFARPKMVFTATKGSAAIIFDYPAVLEKTAPESYFEYFEKQLFDFCGGFYQMLYKSGENGNF